MTEHPNKLSQFWQELKRRKVVKVIILYATTAFILLQIVNMIVEPLHLPQWVETFFIVVLVLGFPIAVIFSWIFDVTPEGIQVTVASHNNDTGNIATRSSRNVVTNIIIAVLIIVVAILVYPKVFTGTSKFNPDLEKSIAVLPFIDDSPEEGNTHIVNGLMEEILDKLENIQDLNVKSRAAVEQYRERNLSIREIGAELGVNFIISGSGQKVGNRIKIMVQLVESASGNSLWSNPYVKEVVEEGIFELQEDVALSVASELMAFITPEEAKRIAKRPTENLEAYENYLKGRELLFARNNESLLEAITFFEKAVELDNEFASAYAGLASAYYYLDDTYRYDKQRGTRFGEKIGTYAEAALLFDPESDLSWIAKAQYYQNKGEQETAVKYLEKALEINPNSSHVMRILGSFYGSLNFDKRLEYALLAVNTDFTLTDAGEEKNRSSDYYRLGFVFRSLGFFDEAEKYQKLALEIMPDHRRAQDELIQILIDKSGDYRQSTQLYLNLISNGIVDAEIQRELAVSYYKLKDFKRAWDNYQLWLKTLEKENVVYNGQESARFAVIHSALGEHKKALERIDQYFDYAEDRQSNVELMKAYAMQGDVATALEHMELMANGDFPYSLIRNLKDDPVYDNLREIPQFQTTVKEMETKFWDNHDRIEANLKEKGLL